MQIHRIKFLYDFQIRFDYAHIHKNNEISVCTAKIIVENSIKSVQMKKMIFELPLDWKCFINYLVASIRQHSRPTFSSVWNENQILELDLSQTFQLNDV